MSQDKTKEEIVTEIYKRSITHIEGHEKLKLGKASMIALSEVYEAMETYAQSLPPSNPDSYREVVSDEDIYKLCPYKFSGDSYLWVQGFKACLSRLSNVTDKSEAVEFHKFAIGCKVKVLYVYNGRTRSLEELYSIFKQSKTK